MTTKEQKKIWNKSWIENNRERYNATKWIYIEKLKREAMLHYGNGKIACPCGVTDMAILTLDHINDDGADRRRELYGSNTHSGSTYQQFKKMGFPPGLQILCFNCNWKKEMNRRLEKRLENSFYKQYYTTTKMNGILPNQLQSSTTPD